MQKRSGRIINHVGDIPQTTQFLVIHDSSYSAMGHDYGPPDPPPSMETTYTTVTVAFDTEEELLAWIEHNNSQPNYSKKKFVVVPYKPLVVKSEVKISLG